MVRAGYNRTEWKELSYLEKVDVVAYFRIKKLVGLHENDAVQKHYEQLQRKMRKKR